ncbi:MAG: TonB-dependent receptor [Candidatus Solibacter usitatus]|nr:TonB-dependent receptor [Candidatus Solibacter usitatus]
MFAALLLTVLSFPALPADHITGVIRDASGAVAPGLNLQLVNSERAVLASVTTDARGRFSLIGITAGDYMLVVTRLGSVERRLPLRIGVATREIEVLLDDPIRRDSVTATASLGTVDAAERVPQAVTLIGRDELQQRAKTVVAQVANEEPGLAWQRTSPTISGISVRGLTGNKVNVFVDGVRYSTGAMRGGINTFLDLVDPSSVEAVEILRGPSSAQFGSDALGGSVQFRSHVPLFDEKTPWHGSMGTFFNSADAGYGSTAGVSYSKGRVASLLNLTGHRANRLRTGRAVDSRSAVTRFLGLPSSAGFEGRIPDSAFTQYGGLARLYYTAGGDSQWIGHYQRAQQDGGKRFDQLLGGDGNRIAELRNLMLDLVYFRFHKGKLGLLDNFSATYSFNAQREERVNQGGNGNPLAAINHEPERTRAHGLHSNTGKRVNDRWSFFLGGEYYHERIAAPSYGYNPVANAFSLRRGRVPDNALYHNGGAYLQNIVEVLPNKLRIIGSVRWNAAAYESRAANLWPEDSMRVNSATYRIGALTTIAPGLSLLGSASRGFRAPHVTDLGTLGLTGSGFEVAAPDVARLGGMVGTTADANAVSTGIAVTQVKPEIALSYEGGLRYRNRRFKTEAMLFVNDINENLVKQSLILPQGAVGKLLGSDTITSQNANGVVFVAASTSPVLVRTNYDNARIWGFEYKVDVKVSSNWDAAAVFTYLHARDTRTGLAPNIEGGTPPPNGYFRVRYTSARRFWIEPFLHAANRQDRLSSLDLSDRRTGASRSRGNIAAFFQNGATARGLVRGGILLPTGETLSQVQNRVLGSEASAPMFTKLNGYATFNLRAGWRVGERQNVIFELENIFDRNYRGISWGIDAPGRGVYLRYNVHF